MEELEDLVHRLVPSLVGASDETLRNLAESTSAGARRPRREAGRTHAQARSAALRDASDFEESTTHSFQSAGRASAKNSGMSARREQSAAHKKEGER